MVNYLKKSLALISVLLRISSCDRGCVESYQFDTQVISVNAKPTADGIDGNQYNHITGGQSAQWHTTGLRTNGEPIIVSISGGWTAWNTAWPAGVNAEEGLEALRQCTMCFKKPGVENCMCAPGQNSLSEPVITGSLNDCSDSDIGKANQDDPDKCTCTSQQGYISDEGVYAYAIDYQKKNLGQITPDDQKECKYNKGLGLYIALFGADGETTPKRAYHLYSFTEICDVARRADGSCVDSDGNDVTRYLATPGGDKMLVKDDKGTEDPSDDEYHGPRERVKVRISDRFYSDNYGGYNLIFIGGVIKDEEKGLLEYIVGNFEDALLGKIPTGCVSDCKRSGGAIEYLYNSIVKDSTFIFIVQLILVLYIVIFGIFTLAGVVEINRKEVMKRVLKISLVIFFTSPTSWYFYNQFVIGLFKDSMDMIISMFMGFADQTFFTTDTGAAIQSNSMVTISQMERATSASNATRFSYVDLTIKMLFSEAVSKKIWSLLIGVWFGIFYIPAIYGLIFFFTYTMLTAALVYIVAMIKLVFVIALGPLFIISSLFAQTEGVFKKWISFMAARSIEIVVMFIVLYTFLVMINNDFKSLFSYRACVEPYNIGLFSLDIIKVYSSRDLFGWISILLKIGALIFLLRLIMEKIPAFANVMVQISGTAAIGSLASDRAEANRSAFGIARNVMGKIYEAGETAVSRATPAILEKVYDAGGFVADKTGFTEKWNNLKEKIPVRNPISLARDMAIDGAIKSATTAAKAKGLTDAALDKEVRKQTVNALFKSLTKGNDTRVHTEFDSATMKMLGINSESIAKRLDEKLVKEPLKKIIKEEAAKLKNQDGRLIPIGHKMRVELKEKVMARAAKEMSSDSRTVEKYLSNMKDLMREKSELSSDEAAKKFAGRPELQSKFLEHLKEQQVQRKLSIEKGEKQGGLAAIGAAFRRGPGWNSAKNIEENFIRKTKYEEERKNSGLLNKATNTSKGFGVFSRINFLDKYADKLKTKAQQEVGMYPLTSGRFDKYLAKKEAHDFEAIGRNKSIAAYENYLLSGYKKDRQRIDDEYKQEMDKFRNNTGILTKLEIEKNKRESEGFVVKKLHKYARKLNITLSGEHEERVLDRVVRVDGADLPAIDPAAPLAVTRSEKADKVLESLDNIANPSVPDAKDDKSKEQKDNPDVKDDKSKEQKDKERDKEIEDSLAEYKKNLKEHYAAEKQALKTEIGDLKSKVRDHQKRIAELKSRKSKTDLSFNEKSELEQLEYDVQRDSTKLSIMEGQEKRITETLNKIDK